MDAATPDDALAWAEATPAADADVLDEALALGVAPGAELAEAAFAVEADVPAACALVPEAMSAPLVGPCDAAADV